MKISNIYIGGWFQRTMLQLSEIYDFMLEGKTELKLDKKKLTEYRNNLLINQLEYGVSGEEFIHYTTSVGVNVKIFEDGLVILNCSDVKEETLNESIEKVQTYYEKNLSPAFSYLFSLGAPVPKELANIKTVYPYFIVTEKAEKEAILNLLNKTDRQKYYAFESTKYDVVRGDMYYFINNKAQSKERIERYIEEQVFMREFKTQLHRYLNIHRIVWEKIDDVKANDKVRGKDIVKFTTQLESYAKTINLIDGRINQMGTYLPTRTKIAKEDSELIEFLDIFGYRYETLSDTLEYIKHLWAMTKNYVSAAQNQFESLKTDITSKSIDSLAIVTSMTAGATIIGLFQSAQPEFTWFGVVYVLFLIIFAWGSQKVIDRVANRRKYDVTDVEYEKNIK